MARASTQPPATEQQANHSAIASTLGSARDRVRAWVESHPDQVGRGLVKLGGLLGLGAVVVVLLVEPSLAQSNSTGLNASQVPGAQSGDPQQAFKDIVFWFRGLAGIVTIAMLIWAGMALQINGNSPEGWQNFKMRLGAAVIGLFLIALAPTIVGALLGVV